jgi:hypothetical protein
VNFRISVGNLDTFLFTGVSKFCAAPKNLEKGHSLAGQVIGNHTRNGNETTSKSISDNKIAKLAHRFEIKGSHPSILGTVYAL